MTDPSVSHDDMLSFLWRSRMDIPQISQGSRAGLADAAVKPEEPGGDRGAAGVPRQRLTRRATVSPCRVMLGSNVLWEVANESSGGGKVDLEFARFLRRLRLGSYPMTQSTPPSEDS